MRIIVALLLVATAGAASAATDSDPNSMGFYFDTNADVVETTVASVVPFSGYVILVNSTETYLAGFEVSYRIQLPNGFGPDRLIVFQALGGGLNTVPGNTVLGGDYVVF